MGNTKSEPDWSAADVPSMAGRFVLVTGANSGIGLETARVLLDKGAKVVMAGRSKEKLDAAVADVSGGIPADDEREGSVTPMVLDLASLESIRAFAAEYKEKVGKLDILINNAGIMAPAEKLLSAEGWEKQMATNHLGHFALTALLFPLLQESPGARVISVSSTAHNAMAPRPIPVFLDNLDGKSRPYEPWTRYGETKSANILFTRELARRCEAAGVNVLAAACHPGYTATNLQTGTMFAWTNFMGQSPAMGALPTLRAATDPSVKPRDYFGPKRRMAGPPILEDPDPAVLNDELAKDLWDKSEELTGISFTFPDPPAAGAAGGGGAAP